MTAIELIAAERTRQIENEKWTAEHDDAHERGELLIAGLAYGTAAQHQGMHGKKADMDFVRDMFWPWNEDAWKPGDRRRNLVKAAALIAAEIDRDIRQNDL